MSDLAQGLEVSLLGIIITFVALGVFILIMVVLQRLFPAKEAVENGEEQAPEEPVAAPVETSASEDEQAVIAAIAAAVGFLRAQNRADLGGGLHEGRSGWWASHRLDAQLGKVEKR